MRNNAAKYGYGQDVIAKSLDSGPDFCYFTCIKYATRMYFVSKMPFLKRWYYRLILHKGGRRMDHEKILDCLGRMTPRYRSTAYQCMEECERIMQNGVE